MKNVLNKIPVVSDFYVVLNSPLGGTTSSLKKPAVKKSYNFFSSFNGLVSEFSLTSKQTQKRTFVNSSF